MNKKVALGHAIEYTAVILAILIAIGIWSGLITHGFTARSEEIIARESDPVSVEYNMAQMFEGIKGELKSVDLYVCNDMSGQVITFRLYDENHEQIYEQFYNVDVDFVAPGFIHIPIRYPMEAGKEYSFIVEGLTADLYLAYEDRSTTTSPVNYFMAYGGAEVPEYDLIVRYNYRCPFRWWVSLIVTLVLIAFCGGLAFVLKKVKKEVMIRRYIAYVCNPLLAAAALATAYIVMVTRIFGFDTKNNAFITMGIWMLIAFLAYIVNFCEVLWGKLFEKRHVCLKACFGSLPIGRIVRITAIATVLWYCYEYMNSLYDIYHYYSVTKFVIAFCFVLISTYDRKEIFNIFNGIWLIAGPILGYVYYKNNFGSAEEYWNELFRLNAWAIAVGGFVIINLIFSTVRACRKKVSLPKPNLMFLIPFAVFATGICVLNNGRNWTYLLAGACVLLMHRLFFWQDREDFTKDLCSGIILTFYMMVWYSLRHRPYYYYVYYRYNMGYHTVTVTAYYLAMIICAAWMRLYEAYRKGKGIKTYLPRLFTFGMAFSYLVFTMSRTGFLSALTMLLFGLTVTGAYYCRADRIKSGVKLTGLMLAAIIYMFPVTFALTDTVPRIANDPVVFEFEVRDFSFSKGMPYADADYMTIEQFAKEFAKKVFNYDPEANVAKIDLKAGGAVTDQRAAQETSEVSATMFTLPVYAAEEAPDENDGGSEEDVTDMSNGRLDIFRNYIENWNLWGHEEMETVMPNGETVIHAHNTFLQVAHDHGIVFGIYFLLFTGYVIIIYLIRAFKNREDEYRIFGSVILVCFCMASLVEWILHPCNPFACAVFLAMMPLCYRECIGTPVGEPVKKGKDEESN